MGSLIVVIEVSLSGQLVVFAFHLERKVTSKKGRLS